MGKVRKTKVKRVTGTPSKTVVLLARYLPLNRLYMGVNELGARVYSLIE